MVAHRLNEKKRPYALYAFVWAFVLSAMIVAPIMIQDNGYFLYYGDFNVQEIPFYKLAHDSILRGDVKWSHLTDLGANFVGSYSFYLLGSPFFWVTMILPSEWVAYAIGPLLVLKLAFCSLSAYIYLRRYVGDKKYAVVGGILYAFSGFSVYNIFFFHFHEAMIAFPLLLAAFDEFHATKRKGIVGLAVFFAATINYYFFFGQVVFVIIYYIIKLVSKSYRFKIKEFISLAIECILGTAMSLFLMLPSLAAILGNYRVSQIVNGWNAVIYNKTQRYLQIFFSFFFPADVPAKNNFTPTAGAKWSSVAAYLPMFSMTFVIAYLLDKKRSFFRRLIFILLIMAFVPFFNSAFQSFNDSYYARWFYMLTLMMIVVTVQSLSQLKDIDFKRGFLPTIVITLAIALIVGLTPSYGDKNSSNIKTLEFGLEESPKHFWIFVGIAVGGLILTFILNLIARKKPKFFYRATALFLSLFVCGYSIVYLYAAKMYSDNTPEFMINYALNYGEDITLEDIDDVRSDFYSTADNMGMFWQVPTIQAFHSIVPGSLMEFYNTTGVQRDVGSRPSTDVYGLRALLSVKYLFAEHDENKPADKVFEKMPGYEHIGCENGFEIYENQYYIPMGFTYDQYITEEEYKDLSNQIKHLALLKALVLTQDQMKKYADITGYTDGMYLNLNFSHDDNRPQDVSKPEYDGFDSITADFDYTEKAYFEDASRLAENTCSSFEYNNDGFTAEFTNKGDDNLLFFSVPYDEGWSATVNGEPVDIEKVNIGLMAVKVDGHSTSEIEFRYKTPMLKEGSIIASITLGAFIIYLIVCKGFTSKRQYRKTYRKKQEPVKKQKRKNNLFYNGNHIYEEDNDELWRKNNGL